MSMSDFLGLGLPRLAGREEARTESLIALRPLRRVLAFLGHSIDEVCENPIVKNKVYGYYKLYRQIDRWGKITELERQWNSVGNRI